MNKAMDPLFLLRDYVMHNKKIKRQDRELIFGHIRLPFNTPIAWIN